MAAKHHHDAKETERQDAAAAQQPSAAEPGAAQPAAGGLTPEAIAQLEQLGSLHEQHVLSDEEFEREKAKVLGGA